MKKYGTSMAKGKMNDNGERFANMHSFNGLVTGSTVF